MRDILTDKKLMIGSLVGMGVLFMIFYIAGSLSTPEKPCFVMVPEEYCQSWTEISYLGNDAVGFNLPVGTPIHAPYDGAFFEDTILYEDEIDTIEAETPIRARFGIPGTSSFVIFTGEHAPLLESGSGVTAGEHVANMSVLASEGVIHEDTSSNIVFYTTNYDLSSLFE